MLRMIMGTAGTGKTTRLISAVKTVVDKGQKAILLVPEQYSFASERLLYQELGPRRVLEVEVFSFTRLCNAIFRRFGGLAGVAVSEAGKYLLMSVALGELKDMLQVYRKSAVNPSFLKTMVEACSEFKAAGITPEGLEELAVTCEETALGDKLDELSAIYGAYQGLLSRGYTDPDDDLIRTIKMLGEHNFFGGIHVFIDGFTTFMAAEFALLGRVIAQAESVTIALTADSLHDNQADTGVFSPVKAAAAKLSRYAKMNGAGVQTPEILDAPLRYRSEALSHISRYFLHPAAPAFTGDGHDALHLYEAREMYGEVEYIAAQIARLVREEGYRYKEIAVVGRAPEHYQRAIASVFSRYDIPYFSDEREEAEIFPLISGVLSALDAVRSNLDPEAVLSFAKSPVLHLEITRVAALENYCYCWGVRGAVWTTPFANNPRGMVEMLTEEDRVLLEEINAIREQVVSPLLTLREGLRKTDGKKFAHALYCFLQDTRVADNLSAYAQGLEQGLRESFLDQNAQLWDILMEILDVFGAVLGGVGLTTRRVCELFRLAVGTADMAQVPQMLDQVLVGAADRIRPGEVRAVFVIGANEGVFPPQIGSGGLFTEAERQEMVRLGAEIEPPSVQQAVLEKFYTYFALALPAEKLYISYPIADMAGKEMQPSLIVSQIKLMFKGIKADKLDCFTIISGKKSAFHLLAGRYREDTALTASLLYHFAENGQKDTMERIEKAALKPPYQIVNHKLSRELFGRSMHLSPSRVERYYRCPFSYFAADGLSLKKRRKVEFSPLESGSVVHNVLQVMVQRHGGKGLAALSQEQMALEVRQIITEYLEQRVEDTKALPTRFQYLFTRLTGTLARLLAHLGREFAQSDFEPVAVELPISREEGVEPLRLISADGTPVTVEGVVDRVDVMEKNGRRYVRVVDYKSGGKDFKLHDILYGLNMQMLLYLFTIQEQGTGGLENAIPAGVLYMPVQESYISTARDDADTSGEREKQWRMNGLLLEDEEVLRGMEKDMAGVFIPAKLNKKGELDAKSSLANLSQMGKLSDKVREVVTQMAGALKQGCIPAVPVEGGDFDTCAYCDYRPVCGHEPGDPVKAIAKIDREAFFKMLEEEGRDA